MAEEHKPNLFLILTAIQLLHSCEEILTGLHERFPIVTGKIHESISFFPIVNVSGSTFIALNVVFVTFLLLICFFVYRNRRWAWKIAKIVAIVEVINGLVHLSAAIFTGGYFPGAISGLGLMIVGFLLLRSLSKNAIEDSLS